MADITTNMNYYIPQKPKPRSIVIAPRSSSPKIGPSAVLNFRAFLINSAHIPARPAATLQQWHLPDRIYGMAWV